jgi:hypothetical protein
MERTGDNEYTLTLKSKVGPVSATFKGELGLRDIVPGESYILEFNGSGGAAGFSKGSAAVRLEPGSEGTHLHYTVDAKIGGKITQIGQRLVAGAARKMADDFFSRFERIVAPAQTPAGDGGTESGGAEAGDAGIIARGRNWLYRTAGVIIVLVLAWRWIGG